MLPSREARKNQAEEERIACLDKRCEGDVYPARDPMKEEVLKINGQFFIGPSEYFSSGINGASFGWWEHQPLKPFLPRPERAQKIVSAGRKELLSITIFLRSNNIPPEPRGYQLIELAQKNGWISNRQIVRPGLEAIAMKHVIGPRNHYIDHVTYYVATELRGPDGLPPVATCDHKDTEYGSGGTGFMWSPGIWAGTRMHQKQCADWPEIYQEMTRILKKLRKV